MKIKKRNHRYMNIIFVISFIINLIFVSIYCSTISATFKHSIYTYNRNDSKAKLLDFKLNQDNLDAIHQISYYNETNRIYFNDTTIFNGTNLTFDKHLYIDKNACVTFINSKIDFLNYTFIFNKGILNIINSTLIFELNLTNLNQTDSFRSIMNGGTLILNFSRIAAKKPLHFNKNFHFGDVMHYGILNFWGNFTINNSEISNFTIGIIYGAENNEITNTKFENNWIAVALSGSTVLYNNTFVNNIHAVYLSGNYTIMNNTFIVTDSLKEILGDIPTRGLYIHESHGNISKNAFIDIKYPIYLEGYNHTIDNNVFKSNYNTFGSSIVIETIKTHPNKKEIVNILNNSFYNQEIPLWITESCESGWIDILFANNLVYVAKYAILMNCTSPNTFIYSGYKYNLTAVNNEIFDGGFISIDATDQINLKENIINNTKITITRTNYVAIENNSIYNGTIFVENCKTVIIKNNVITSYSLIPISVLFSKTVSVEDNSVDFISLSNLLEQSFALVLITTILAFFVAVLMLLKMYQKSLLQKVSYIFKNY